MTGLENKAITQKDRLKIFQIFDKENQNKLTGIHKAKHPLTEK